MTAQARFPFSAVVGLSEARLALLLAAVDPGIGGVLLRGDKGSAKSTLARGLAGMLPGGAPFVELPLGATEDRVLGTLDPTAGSPEGGTGFRPGLLAAAHGGVLYVDEVNLLPDHLVDVLLDVAASGVNRVERDGVSHSHPARFVLVGSMNPEEGELRPQLLDRFGLSVEITAPTDPVQRAEIVRRRLTHDAGGEVGGAEGDIVLRARLAAAMPADLPDTVVDFACRLAVSVGAEGLRADLVLCRAAAAFAGWEGRSVATAEDVERVASVALGHRRRRRPFDPPTLSEGELERALDAARLSFADAYRRHEPPGPAGDGDGHEVAGTGTGDAPGADATGGPGPAPEPGTATEVADAGPGDTAGQPARAAAEGADRAPAYPGHGGDAAPDDAAARGAATGPDGTTDPGAGDPGALAPLGDATEPGSPAESGTAHPGDATEPGGALPAGGDAGTVPATGEGNGGHAPAPDSATATTATAATRETPAGAGHDGHDGDGTGATTERSQSPPAGGDDALASGGPDPEGSPGGHDHDPESGDGGVRPPAATWVPGPPPESAGGHFAATGPSGTWPSMAGEAFRAPPPPRHLAPPGPAASPPRGPATGEAGDGRPPSPPSQRRGHTGPAGAVAVAATAPATSPPRPAELPGPAVAVDDRREPARSRTVGRTVVVAVDASGSTGTHRRVEAATGAVLGLLADAYLRRDRVAMVTFRADGAEVVLPPTASVELARARLAELPTGGVTPLAEGISAGLSLARRAAADGWPPLLVLVTDGRATGTQHAADRARAAAAEVADAGVEAIVVDAEDGPDPQGPAAGLAEAMGARHLRLDELSASQVESVVRDALH